MFISILVLFLVTIGVPISLYLVDDRDNMALLKNNIALLNPFTDTNNTMQPQTSPPSSNFVSQEVHQAPEMNIRHSPADKE
jgi:hypothetical protein